MLAKFCLMMSGRFAELLEIYKTFWVKIMFISHLSMKNKDLGTSQHFGFKNVAMPNLKSQK